MGDTTDGIKGCPGIGKKYAAQYLKLYGTVEGCIEAARAGDDRIRPKQRSALIEFEQYLGITRQLVTLKTDLPIPNDTELTHAQV